MSHHKFTNPGEIFQGDLNDKPIEGITFQDFMDSKCNCMSSALVNGKCICGPWVVRSSNWLIIALWCSPQWRKTKNFICNKPPNGQLKGKKLMIASDAIVDNCVIDAIVTWLHVKHFQIVFTIVNVSCHRNNTIVIVTELQLQL